MKRLLILTLVLFGLSLGAGYPRLVFSVGGFHGDTLSDSVYITRYENSLTAWDTFCLTAGLYTTVTWSGDTAAVGVDTGALRTWVGAVVAAPETLTAGLWIVTSNERVGDDTVSVDSGAVHSAGDAWWLSIAYGDTILLVRDTANQALADAATAQDTANAALARRDTLAAGYGISVLNVAVGDDTVSLDTGTVRTWVATVKVDSATHADVADSAGLAGFADSCRAAAYADSCRAAAYADSSRVAVTAYNSADSTWADAFLTNMWLGTPTYTSIHDGWSQLNSGGLISGGGLTPLDSYVVVGAAQFAIKTTDSENGDLVFAETDVCTLLMVDSAVNYVFVYYNGGTPRCTSTTTRSDINLTDEFTLGRAYRHADDCDVMSIGTSLHNYQRRQNERLLARGNAERMSGAIISEVATLQVAITDGVFYVGNDKWSSSAWSSDTANFEHYYYRTGAGVWAEVAATGKIDSVRWNDLSGADSLADLTTNRYGVHWIYVCFGNELSVVYGNGNYVSLAIADTASPPSTLPDYISKFAVLAGRVIVKKSASTFSSVQVAWTNEFIPGAVTVHNDLAGLNDNDYKHLTAAEYASLDSAEYLQGQDTTALWNAKTLQGQDTAALRALYDSVDYAIWAESSSTLQGKDTTALWDAKTLQAQDTGELRALYDTVDYAVIAETALTLQGKDTTWVKSLASGADSFLLGQNMQDATTYITNADSIALADSINLLAVRCTTVYADLQGTLQGQDTGELRSLYDSVDYAIVADTATRFRNDSLIGTVAQATRFRGHLVPRCSTISNPANVVANSDGYDQISVTGLAQTCSLKIPAGTPVAGQKLILRIKDDGTSRTLGWNPIWRAFTGITLSTATTLGKTMYWGFVYNNTDTKWDCLASQVEP